MAHTYTRLRYHIVFSTKLRHPWIDVPMRPKRHKYLGGGIRDEGGKALIVGGVEDHVHIFAGLPATKSIADIVRAVKANSSGWIHRQFPALHDFAWQSGYAAFTVSVSKSEQVRHYVATQEEHHRKQSFEDEL